MAWDANYPLNTTPVSASTEQQRDNFIAFESWLDVAHRPVGHPEQGRHIPGKTGVVRFDTQENILATTAAGLGAIQHATDTGQTFIYTADGWKSLTETYYSRVRDVFDTFSPSGSVWTTITSWGSQNAIDLYDSLSEFNTANNSTFIPRAAGTYLIVYNAVFSGSSNFQAAIGVFVNSILRSIYKKAGLKLIKCDGADILYLLPGDNVQIAVWHNSTTAVTVENGSLYIHRLA